MSIFLDPRLEAIAPYVPGEQPRGRDVIKLNTNESPYPPVPGVVRAVAEAAESLNRYPDPTANALAEAMAAHLRVAPENVFLCNGSDEVLAFIFQALCPRGAAFADLTYGFYPVFSQLYGTAAKAVPLREDFTLAVEDYAGLAETVIIANPNAPTGLSLPLAAIETVVAEDPARLVVVDEAYVDFGGESAVPLLQKYENLLVVGTFSKSRSLAGARLGYAVASPALIADLERIKYSFNPYNLSRTAQAAGVAALEAGDYYRTCCAKVMKTRDDTAQKLRALGFACTQSKTNFLFASHPALSGQALYGELKRRGILVRWFNVLRIKDYLRITVGTPEEMARLTEELEDIIRKGLDI